MDKLTEILRAEGRRMSDEFSLASDQGKGTPQEVADFREHAVQHFLSCFLPQSHIVSKGKVTDLDGMQSDSIDCLILNPAHPNLVDSKGKFRLIFSDGCDAAIEVKPNLARRDELHRGLKQCQSVKRVVRSKSPLLLKLNRAEHLLAYSTRIPFYLFAVSSFEPYDLCLEIADFYRVHRVPVQEQIDGVVILGKGVLKHIQYAELNVYAHEPPLGKSAGWYFEDWGDATLFGMLFALELSTPAVASVAEPIMRRVLRKAARFNVARFCDSIGEA